MDKQPSEGQIVMASNNPGKLSEIQAILQDAGKRVLPQSHFFLESVDETGLTFVENAILKARYACAKSGLAALADDSGIEVDALCGQPGIYSARYAGPGASDEENMQKLLLALTDCNDEQRGARFWCTMVYLKHENDPCPVICQAAWEGSILHAPQGENGFGYDPIFQPNGFSCSVAELGSVEKNRISHRAQALAQLRQYFY